MRLRGLTAVVIMVVIGNVVTMTNLDITIIASRYRTAIRDFNMAL
ncbi:exported hypothetical protein [Vibrio nigripulchritudo ENn2]|nr:exported hypothetical protein [Vibrio nigripulchritudo ENn2]CCO41530.1 exported hypothetical protein [Vibrio nigripulchritudo SFn135]